MAFASLSDLVQHYENAAGDPTALNYRYDATHTASGLYQITNTTWAGYGGYSSAAAAPSDVQTAKFSDLVSSRGLADWLCPGCNPRLTDYVNANPDVMNLPITSAGGFTQAQASDLTAPIGSGTPTSLTATGVAAGASTGNTGAGIVSGITGYISGVAGRLLYAVAGIVLIIMAVFVYALRTRDQG